MAGKRRARTSVIAACQPGKLVAPLTFAGTCNTAVVDAYFAHVLLPVLPVQVIGSGNQMTDWSDAVQHMST